VGHLPAAFERQQGLAFRARQLVAAQKLDVEAGGAVALEIIGATLAGVMVARGIDEAEFDGLLGGHRHQQNGEASGYQNAVDFRQGEVVFEHMFEHMAGQDEVEGAVSKG